MKEETRVQASDDISEVDAMEVTHSARSDVSMHFTTPLGAAKANNSGKFMS